MRRRLVKITVLSFLSVAAAVVIIVGAFLWRLSQGPVSLDFLAERVQNSINARLAGMTIGLEGLVIERKPGSGAPSFHMRDVELRDARGGVIARAPRAGVTVDQSALLSGLFVPTAIELIGPRILVRRTQAGTIELGFGDVSSDDGAAAFQANEPHSTRSGKSDRGPARQRIAPETPGEALIEALSGKPQGAGAARSGIDSLDAIRISQASIALYDEANNSYWSAPRADLAFKRMPFGFTVAASATVASGGEPWRTEVTATYRRESRSFAIGARIADLVPANISDEIFALSKLAQVRLPLSGEAEFEIGQNGRIFKASAMFSAAAGRVGLPNFIAEPILVDEGSLKVDYDPATGGIVIGQSAVLVGGSRAELTGRIDPVRLPDGTFAALAIKLNAHDISLDTAGTVKDALAIERIDFDGTARVDAARLDINDVVIVAGNAGVRVRGAITGGEKSPGIRLAGRIQELPASMLKKLWPPVVAPNTRKWVEENIKAGRITDGEFTVNLAADALAAALERELLPDPSIDARFHMQGVSTTYFGGLPAIRGAEGEAHLRGDTFDIAFKNGAVELPSGKTISIASGSMAATSLLAELTPTQFAFEALGSSAAALEYMALPPLELLRNSGIDARKLGGEVKVSLGLSLPLAKDVPRDSVSVRVKARIADASLKDAIGGIDLSEGAIDLTVENGLIEAKGPVRLNGMAAKLGWSRGTGKNARQSAVIETELDDSERKKIGADINDFVRGPVKVKVTVPNLDDADPSLMVEADLSKAELRLDAISWARPPRPRTTAAFDYLPGGGKGGEVKNLTIDGAGVSIKGDIKLGARGGLSEAELSTVVLGDDNRFAVSVKSSDGGMAVSIAGRSFDARPLIKSMFDSKGARAKANDSDQASMTVEADLERILAHRGEILVGVRGSLSTLGGSVRSADLHGSFISGQPVSFRMTPVDGGRELQIGGRDGGAALRAANLYSKVAGGNLEFTALLGSGAEGSLRSGRLVLRDFEVRNEAALAELDKKGKPRKSGPRRDGIVFSRLTLPFTADSRFIRIGDTLIKGPELCATAEGVIRKADGVMDIDGTIIPACSINKLAGDIPILGDLLVPDGLFGLTYALGGAISNPEFQVNPVSVIAPGIFRKFFEYGSNPSPAGKARAN